MLETVFEKILPHSEVVDVVEGDRRWSRWSEVVEVGLGGWWWLEVVEVVGGRLSVDEIFEIFLKFDQNRPCCIAG